MGQNGAVSIEFAMSAWGLNRRCWQRKVTSGLPLKADL